MDRRSGGPGRLWLGLPRRLPDANGEKDERQVPLAVVIVALPVAAGFVAFLDAAHDRLLWTRAP
ncbi:hypothetical protein [Streptosporangium pseudovulgare]|nr:hypothetical protein [Streptosporangium pseudovulgare]